MRALRRFYALRRSRVAVLVAVLASLIRVVGFGVPPAYADGVAGGSWSDDTDSTPILPPSNPALPSPWPTDFTPTSSPTLLPPGTFDGLPDATKLLNPGNVLNGVLPNVISTATQLENTALDTVNQLKGLLNSVGPTLQGYLPAVNLPAASVELPTLVQHLAYLPQLPDTPQLPTSYSLTLNSALGSSNYTNLQICAPQPINWPGSVVADAVVTLCPSPSPAVYFKIQYTGLTSPPLNGSVAATYTIPQVPGVINATTLHVGAAVVSNQSFPSVFTLNVQSQQGSGNYAAGQQLTETLDSENTPLIGSNVAVPLTNASVSLDGYGASVVNNFPGGNSSETIQYVPGQRFGISFAEDQQPPSNQSLYLEADAGGQKIDDATLLAVPQSFNYEGKISYQQLTSGPVANGLEVQGQTVQTGMSITLHEYASNALEMTLYQRDLPLSFDKSLTVQFDSSGQYPIEIRSDQRNSSTNADDLLALGRYANGSLSSSIEVGGASNTTTVRFAPTYDSTNTPIGFSASSQNTPAIPNLLFQIAVYSGTSTLDRVLLSQDLAASSYFHPVAGSTFDFTLTGADPNFSFAVQPASYSSTHSGGVGYNIQAGMASDRPGVTASLAANANASNAVGFVIRQIPQALNLTIDAATADANSSSLYVDETDSTLLNGALRTFFDGNRAAPAHTLTVRGPSAVSSGIPLGSAVNLTRSNPPPHFTFDLEAPRGNCNAPNQVNFHNNNYNLASPSGTDTLTLGAPAASITYSAIPAGEATRTINFSFDAATCQPTDVHFTGVAQVAQPAESIRVRSNSGQIMIASLAPQFSTDLQTTISTGSTQVAMTQSNSSNNPGQFIQGAILDWDGVPSRVVTVKSGALPVGAVSTTGRTASVVATAMDPSEFVLNLSADTTDGDALHINGSNNSIQTGASVSAGQTGQGSITLTNLGKTYDVKATVATGNAAPHVTVTGQARDASANPYPNMVVSGQGNVAGIQASFVISGTGVASPPSPDPSAGIQASWKSAPSSTFTFDTQASSAGSTPSTSLSLTSGENDPGSLLYVKVAGASLCAPMSCVVYMGGGLVTGTSSITLSKPNPTGVSYEFDGAYPAEPTTQFVQLGLFNSSGALIAKVTLAGRNGNLSDPISGNALVVASYEEMSDKFSIELDDAQSNGAEHFHAKFSRDPASSSHSWIGIAADDAVSLLPGGAIYLTDLPASMEISGQFTQSEGMGNFDYLASDYGFDLLIIRSDADLALTDMPTHVTGTATLGSDGAGFKTTLDTAGSVCSNAPTQCNIGAASAAVGGLNLVVANSSGLPYPINFDKPVGNVDIRVTGSIFLHYSYGLWAQVSNISSFSLNIGIDKSQTPLPTAVMTKSPQDSSSHEFLQFMGPDLSAGSTPIICAASPCSSLLPDQILFTLEIIYSNPVHPYHDVHGPYNFTWSSAQPGKFGLWGWDQFGTGTTRYQTKETAGAAQSIAINTDTWEGPNCALLACIYPATPFSPPYTHEVNQGGSWSDYPHTRVYVLNPQDALFRDVDESRACKAARIDLFVQTNCFWQAAIDSVTPKT